MDNSEYSRRTFLKFMGTSSLALALSKSRLVAMMNHKASIGLQLYTVRRLIENDFDATIRRIAEMGFAGIETYDLPKSVELNRAAKVFRDNGLKIFSMHVELPVGDRRDYALKLADAYDCDRVVYHGWPQGEKFKDMDATKRTAEAYNEAAAFLRTHGLRFGLHNHWWEYEKTDGVYPAYYLLEHLDKEIFFEIDTYWVKTAGQDPAKAVADFGKRAPLLHIKDGPAVKGDRLYAQLPVGDGVMDFPAIVEAANGNTEWMIVEFDEYDKDIFDGIQKSYTYLTQHGLGEGKV